MTETKNILFCDFDSNINIAPTKNTLSINHISNLTTQNGIIEPFFKTENIFESLLSDSEYENYSTNYFGLHSTSLKIIPYEYFDSETNKNILRIFLIDREKCLNEYKPTENTLVSFEIYFSEIPKAIYHNKELFLFDDLDMFIFKQNSNPSLIENPININYVKFYKNLTYFMIKNNQNTIYISQNTSFSDIAKNEQLPTETLVIDENYGQFQDLLICNNCVYIVQDFGIAKIQSTKDETVFTYFETNSKIIKNTARCVNNYIVFYSSCGIFRFDGNRAVEICENLSKKLGGCAIAESFNNKYYLATTIKHNTISENSLIEIDVVNKIANVMQFGEVVEMFSNKFESIYNLQVVLKNNNARETLILSNDNFESYASTKVVEFNKLFFNTGAVKSIKNISAACEGTLTFEMFSNLGDKISHTSTGYFKLSNIFLKGNYFYIKIYSTSNFSVDSIYIDYIVREND